MRAAWILLFAALLVRIRLHSGVWPYPRPRRGYTEPFADFEDLPVHSVVVFGGAASSLTIIARRAEVGWNSQDARAPVRR